MSNCFNAEFLYSMSLGNHNTRTVILFHFALPCYLYIYSVCACPGSTECRATECLYTDEPSRDAYCTGSYTFSQNIPHDCLLCPWELWELPSNLK